MRKFFIFAFIIAMVMFWGCEVANKSNPVEPETEGMMPTVFSTASVNTNEYIRFEYYQMEYTHNPHLYFYTLPDMNYFLLLIKDGAIQDKLIFIKSQW